MALFNPSPLTPPHPTYKARVSNILTKILSLFYKIRSGEISKSGPIKALIGRVQDRSIDRKSLPSMLVECLENPNDEQLSRRLALQGPIVARYLIDALISS